MRLLFLGEGDFSHSCAVARSYKYFSKLERLQGKVTLKSRDTAKLIEPDYLCSLLGFESLPKALSIVATSLDTVEDVQKIYPNAVPLLAYLQEARINPQTCVAHGVDACNLLETLPNHLQGAYDRIIWHHPHGGVEDKAFHRTLLTRFLKSATCVLAPNGLIILTVLAAQAAQWSLLEVIEEVGMSVRPGAPVVYDTSRLPGVTKRRNKHGGSFENIRTARYHQQTRVSSTYLLVAKKDDTATFLGPIATPNGDP